jgi:hypothetical protein
LVFKSRNLDPAGTCGLPPSGKGVNYGITFKSDIHPEPSGGYRGEVPTLQLPGVVVQALALATFELIVLQRRMHQVSLRDARLFRRVQPWGYPEQSTRR